MSCVGASHVVREGQLLSISPGLFLSSTLGYGSVKKVREAHCKATFNLCLCKVSLLYLHVNACYRPRGLPPNFHGRWGRTTFSKRQYCATYQYVYSKARSSHPFSLILLGNILSLKKKVPGRILVFFFFTGKGKQEDYMPCFVRTPRQQSLHDDHLFSFLKVKRTHNAVVSACF